MKQNIILYSHPDCTYSDALREELNESSVDFEEIDLALNPEQWSHLETLTGGERITPVLLRGAEVEVGFHGVG